MYPQSAGTAAVVGTQAVPGTEAPETVPETEAPETAAPETTEAETEAPETEPEPETPAPGPSVYNFRYRFPEDAADTEDPLQSYGGKAFRELYERDTEWQTSVFRYSTQRPENVAASLGIDRARIMGKYNITDDTHNIDDPSTWDIGKWKNINVSITDGNGKANPVSSNVKEILSMASVYCWYNGIEDYDSFFSYARKLWNASHSSSASIGTVYFDADECITPEQVDKAVRRGNGQRAEAAAETGAADAAAGGSTMAAAPAGGSAGSAEAAEATPADASSGEAVNDGAAGAETGAGSAEAATAPEIPGPGAALMSKSQEQASEAAAAEASAETEAAAAEASAETGAGTDISAGPGVETSADPGTEGTPETDRTEAAETDSALSEFMKCPGHVDLTVKAVIYDFDGGKNLFTVDPVGGNKKNFNERWQGWTETAMAEARALAASDWYESYGLSVSLFSRTSPLSEAEIESYLKLLPEDLSEARRKLAETALGSIGRIPYYFGGKASSAEFDKNHFGSLVGPDYKGRVFRGLDCSGWLAWTWWNTFGTQLAESSTAGLIHLGHEVRRKDLQTGDILVRAGGEETIGHVLMFFRWDEAGNAVCIHETGGVTNNVVMAVQTDMGMSCRNLLD